MIIKERKDFITSKPPKAQLRSASQSLLDETSRSHASKSMSLKTPTQEDLTSSKVVDKNRLADQDFYDENLSNISENQALSESSFYSKPNNDNANNRLEEFYAENFNSLCSTNKQVNSSILSSSSKSAHQIQQSNVQTQTYASLNQKKTNDNLIDLNSSNSTQFHARKSLDAANCLNNNASISFYSNVNTYFENNLNPA